MDVAWKCTLHRSAEGSLTASCAPAGRQAPRTAAIDKTSGRFASMRLTEGGPCRPSFIVTAKCQRVMTNWPADRRRPRCTRDMLVRVQDRRAFLKRAAASLAAGGVVNLNP